MADSSGPRIARNRRELVESRLVDLFADGLPPRPTGDVAAGSGAGRGRGKRERWRDEPMAEEDDPHAGEDDSHDGEDDDPHDAAEVDPFLVDAQTGSTSGRSGGGSAARADSAQGHLAGQATSARSATWARWLHPGRWRIDPERRGALAVMAAILVAGAAVGWQALASRPHAEPVAGTTGTTVASATGSFATVTDTPRASAVSTVGAGAATASAAKVIVDVVGRVHRPGLVTLPAGARVADAVRAAGGALPGTSLSSINLARVCVDGEQIAVGVTGAAAPGPGTAAGSASGAAPGSGVPGALVNLNTATAEQLDALPGVGPVMAQRIIAYRTDHGPFTAVTQLQQVSGIGDAKYADLRPLVTV